MKRNPDLSELVALSEESIRTKKEVSAVIEIEANKITVKKGTRNNGELTEVSLPNDKETVHTHPSVCNSWDACYLEHPSSTDMKIYIEQSNVDSAFPRLQVSAVTSKHYIYLIRCDVAITNNNVNRLSNLVFRYFKCIEKLIDDHEITSKRMKGPRDHHVLWNLACKKLGIFTVYRYDASS